MNPRLCVICGKEYQPLRGRSKVCSPECRHRNRLNVIARCNAISAAKKNEAKKVAFAKSFACAFCGGRPKFEITIRSTERHFCSKECKRNARCKVRREKLNSNPELRQRYREQCRACYHRTSPEKHAAARAKKKARIEWRIAKNHRNRLQGLVTKGFAVKSVASLQLFGCTVQQLKQHLETQFKPGMTWENYGSEWHIDHIIPLAAFDLKKLGEQMKAFRWNNLQPLWAGENWTKGDRTICQKEFALFG